MTKIAAIFPGQGSQFVGMGSDLKETWNEANDVFSEVDDALGFDLSELMWNGPEDQLRLTENTQPALLTHSIAAWRVLEARGITVEAVAGHSLGEYSAIVAAGGIGFSDAARTVQLRGQLMQQAVPVGEGAMAAVIGLDDELTTKICKTCTDELGEPVVAVNFNSPGQVVIAGTTNAVEAASEALIKAGAKRVVALPVSAPFHSPLMASAREGLTPTLEGLAFKKIPVPLYRNIDAAPKTDAHDLCTGLIIQVDAPVLWSAIINQLRDDGFDTFIEVGAGRVLSGLCRRIDRSLTCYQAGTVESIEKTLSALGA